MTRMKTTVDLDEKKLQRVMRLTGLKTRKRAIDFALSEVERLAKVKKLFAEPFYVDDSEEIIDPIYDIQRIRELEKPEGDTH